MRKIDKESREEGREKMYWETLMKKKKRDNILWY